MWVTHRLLLKSAVSGVFTHALPEIGPIFIIGAIPDESAEPARLIIFGYNITVGGFDRLRVNRRIRLFYRCHRICGRALGLRNIGGHFPGARQQIDRHA